MQAFTILHRSFGRRRLISVTLIFTTVEMGAIMLIHHVGFEGLRIGEAAHPGPRLRRRGPRSADARSARRSRGETASDTQESKVGSQEKGMKMLLFNLRGYL